MQNRLLWLAVGVLLIIVGSIVTFMKQPYIGRTIITIGTVVGFGAVVIWRQKEKARK